MPASSSCRFDGIVTEPCAWRIAVDFKAMGRSQVDIWPRRLPDGGNLLEIRGLAGVFVDDEISCRHPRGRRGPSAVQDRRARSTATGRRTWRRRRWRASCRRLPEIVGVVTQGGDGYGAAQAFAAAGRRPRSSSWATARTRLAWWKEQRTPTATRPCRVSIAPGVVDAGLLGRPADPRRRGGAEGPDGAVPSRRRRTRWTRRLPQRPKAGVANASILAGRRQGGDRGASASKDDSWTHCRRFRTRRPSSR